MSGDEAGRTEPTERTERTERTGASVVEPTGSVGAAGEPNPGTGTRDLSQLWLAGLLAVLGVVLLVATSGLRTDFAKIDPVGPRLFPRIVAAGLLLSALALAVATLRGSLPPQEDGEDVDLGARADWPTVARLVAAFAVLVATVDVLGWTIASALFFTACARVLGSRTWVRDLLIGTALGLASFYGFYSGLGVPLPAGVLDGIL